MKAIAITTLALLAISPGARSWLGSLFIALGSDLIDSCPRLEMTDAQKVAGLKRFKEAIEEEKRQLGRNGGRP